MKARGPNRYGRGLFRIWAVLSVVWIASVVWDERRPMAHVAPPNGCERMESADDCAKLLSDSGRNPFEAFGHEESEPNYRSRNERHWFAFGIKALGLPLSLLIAAMIIRWIVAGFTL